MCSELKSSNVGYVELCRVMSFCATSLLKQKKRTVLDPIRENSFFFNNNVSNLYNNTVLLKKIIFTLLMFRKPNKTTIN